MLTRKALVTRLLGKVQLSLLDDLQEQLAAKDQLDLPACSTHLSQPAQLTQQDLPAQPASLDHPALSVPGLADEFYIILCTRDTTVFIFFNWTE